MRSGVFEPYHTDRFFAADNAEAIQKATVWRVTAASTFDEQTWLQVILKGPRSIPKKLGRILVNQADRHEKPGRSSRPLLFPLAVNIETYLSVPLNDFEFDKSEPTFASIWKPKLRQQRNLCEHRRCC